MLKTITFIVGGLASQNDRYRLEAELEVLSGVKETSINLSSGECEIEYDDGRVTPKKINATIKKLGYGVGEKDHRAARRAQECTYWVRGMHCASCEVLIEKKLLKQHGVKAVDASADKGTVIVCYEDDKPSTAALNRIFSGDKYTFSEEPVKIRPASPLVQYDGRGRLSLDREKINDFLTVAGVSLVFIIGFLYLRKTGFSALISVNAASALPIFLLFGLLAGFSSCAALVGGIILSMSKQWTELYATDDSSWKKFHPHLLFNLGRLASYGLLGAILGAVGGIFQFSLTFSSALVIIVSVMMLFLGLQMLGIKKLQKFRLTTPKFVTRYIADESNFRGRYMPMLMGAATFFLPCGFTITAQGLALTSGSALQGGLIMIFFAIGTLPALLLVGISSVTFTRKPHMANRFLKTAGVIVVFFAVFNFNAQLNVLGLPSLDDINLNSGETVKAAEGNLPPIVDGKQVLKMDASSYAYTPNRLRVRTGIPVKWEITDKGTSGCTNAVISNGLFDGQIPLTPGQTSVKEFTPEKAGSYKFSCWMGMVSGIIDVVEITKGGTVVNPLPTDAEVIPSGATGCGCGGGGGGNGTCGG